MITLLYSAHLAEVRAERLSLGRKRGQARKYILQLLGTPLHLEAPFLKLFAPTMELGAAVVKLWGTALNSPPVIWKGRAALRAQPAAL